MVGAPGEALERPAGAAATAAPPAPGLYLHVPFCARVCPYCDFAVRTGGPRKRAAYVEALLGEIALHAAGSSPWRDPRPFDSVYLGGGTPSSLAPEALARILDAVAGGARVVHGAEITLEANPEDVDDERLAAWRALGVTRISLGVQSFDDGALQLLGRSHSAARARQAVERALAAGFDAVSLDLMFAVPGQGADGWRAVLRQAVELQPQHISCYELTIHRGTRFFRARERDLLRELPDDDKAEQFFDAHRLLAEAGYDAYEVSNFARAPEHRSRHNAKYWNHTPYLGVGPSAHSFDGTRTRWWNERRLTDWERALREQGRVACEQEALTPAELVLEALALGLRTRAGIDLAAIERRWGIDLRAANGRTIERLVADGLLRPQEGGVFLPTLEGMAVADALAAAFEIPAPDSRAPAPPDAAQRAGSGGAR